MQRILSKREKNIFYFTIAIIVFSFIFNILIAPVLKRNEGLNREIGLNSRKLKKYLGLLAQKEAILERYSDISPGAIVPERKGDDPVVAMLSEIERFSNDANIRILDIRPQLAKPLSVYKEIVIDLRAEGNMDGFLKFLYNVENSLLSLVIKRLQLNSRPGTQNLEAAFTISQFSPPE